MGDITWWGVPVGSWSDWVAAILTGGSLLLGFYILLRDRRKEERTQANRVAYWTARRLEGKGGWVDRHSVLTINVRNDSDRMITRVRVIAYPLKRGRLKWKLKEESLSIAYQDFLNARKAGHKLGSLYFNEQGELIPIPKQSVLQMLEAQVNDKPLVAAPGEQLEFEVKFWLPSSLYLVQLMFTDADNVRWWRDVNSGNLLRQGKGKFNRGVDQINRFWRRGWPFF